MTASLPGTTESSLSTSNTAPFPTPTAPAEKPRDPRRHDLDALRASAMLLGIVYHGALSLAAGFPWFIQDATANNELNVFQSWVHGFRMPLFFIVSGFFTAMLWKKRGAASLLSHRFRRILLPCIVGAITVVPLCNLAIMSAMMNGAARRAAAANAQPPEESIWAAIRQSRSDIVAQHLEKGVSCEALHPDYKTTPLSWATILGDLLSVRVLLEKGCDPNKANEDGNTPLHSAMFFGRYEIAQALLDHQADSTLRNNNGETPLDSLRVDIAYVPMIAGFLSMSIDMSEVQNGRKLIEADAKHRNLMVPPTKPSSGVNAKANPSGTASTNEPSQFGRRLSQFWGWFSTAPLFSYLWFLWFLWWLVVGFVILQAILKAIWSMIGGGRPLDWSWATTPTTLISMVLLTMLPTSQMAGGGFIFGPDTSVGLIPAPHIFLYYTIFFLYGVAYYLCDDREGKLGRSWRWLLPVSLFVLFPIALELTTGVFGFRAQWGDPKSFRLLSILLQSIFAWSMSIAFIGAFRSLLTTENSTVRYLSDSSYWLYVGHLPLVIVFQTLVSHWNISAWLKLLIISGGTTVILLILYHWVVRPTWIGTFLNGPRPKNKQTGKDQAAVPTSA